MKLTRRVATVLGVLGALSIAIPGLAWATSLITMSGSTAEYPLVSLLANKYYQTTHKAKFKISQGGSTIGVNDVAAGRVTIGNVARNPEKTDPEGLVFYPIAKYAICVVTNKSNPISNLTEAQDVSIFTGKTKNWGEVPGSNANGTIDVISRTSTAGVLTNFQTLMLGGKKVETSAAQESSEGLLEQTVENDKNSIGFLSNYNADNGKVNSVGFNGTACNLANAKAEKYGAVAFFYEVTKGPYTGAAKEFIEWIGSSPAAQKIIGSEWITLH